MIVQLPPQLFVGSMVELDKIKPIKNRPHGFVKPEGGLWTSTYDPDCGSDWVQWNLGERYTGEIREEEGANKIYYDCCLLYPREADICIVDDFEDLEDIFYNYPFRSKGSFGMPEYIDYEALAQDFDAMHLTFRGQRETRMTHPLSLYGWDCESTIWFRDCFSEIEWLGKLGFPECEYPLSVEEPKRKLLGLNRHNPEFSISGDIFFCSCLGCSNEVTKEDALCFFCQEAGCQPYTKPCLAKGFQGLR